MKKIVLVGVLAGLGFVVGCENNKKPTTPPPTQSENLTPPAPYIPPSGGNAPGVTVTPMDNPGTQITPPPEKPDHTKAAPHSPSHSDAVSASGATHVVKKGDSLSKIAAKYYGKSSKKNIDRIKAANGLKSDVIREGQKLKIPGATSSTSTKKKGVSGNK